MIDLIDKIRGRITVDIRERTDPYLGKIRQQELVAKKFTILSNNCWGGAFL